MPLGRLRCPRTAAAARGSLHGGRGALLPGDIDRLELEAEGWIGGRPPELHRRSWWGMAGAAVQIRTEIAIPMAATARLIHATRLCLAMAALVVLTVTGLLLCRERL